MENIQLGKMLLKFIISILLFIDDKVSEMPRSSVELKKVVRYPHKHTWALV